MTKKCFGPKGLRVMSTQCDTCIFRPGNLMQLRPGRLKDMVADVKKHESYVICHKTTTGTAKGAVCRGSFDNVSTMPIQIAERLNFIEFVDPPTKKGSVST